MVRPRLPNRLLRAHGAHHPATRRGTIPLPDFAFELENVTLTPKGAVVQVAGTDYPPGRHVEAKGYGEELSV